MYHKIVFILLVAIGLQSCSSTKNLAEGELLYTGAKVTIEGQIPSKEKKALDILVNFLQSSSLNPNKQSLKVFILLAGIKF